MSAGRLMVIDDDMLVRATLKAILADAGYDVTLAVDGKDGLRQLGGQPIDLVITDILMPEMEGIETIQTIRRRCPEIKILAISGSVTEQGPMFLEMAGKLGADEVLAKPSSPERIVEVIQGLLENGRRSASGSAATDGAASARGSMPTDGTPPLALIEPPAI